MHFPFVLLLDNHDSDPADDASYTTLSSGCRLEDDSGCLFATGQQDGMIGKDLGRLSPDRLFQPRAKQTYLSR